MLKCREEMQEEFTWDLKPLYASDQDWEHEYLQLINEDRDHFPAVNKYKVHLQEQLILLLETYFDHLRKLEKLYTYAHLKHDQDVANNCYQEMQKKIQGLCSRFNTETAWIEPAILCIDESSLSSIMNSDKSKHFKVYIQKLLLMKKHILTEKEEKILALSSFPLGAVSRTFSLLNNADMKFAPAIDSQNKENELTHGSYSLYLKSYDRKLRKTAFENLHKGFFALENSVSELLAGCVSQHDFYAKARNYSSSLEAALFPNQIDPMVYYNLIDTTRKNLRPLHRYLELRKKRLKLEKLEVYDLFVPMVEEVDIHYSYENAVDLVLESLKPLGNDYHEILKKGLKKERWIDVYENKGKRSGAYSSGCYDSFPYMLLNYQGTFSDVMTLSHEIGHSMHSYFSYKHQKYQNSSYSIFVAEVASTFNEELTFRALLANTKSTKERIYILSQKIDSIRSTLFRQTLFADFELKIHEMIEKQEPITPLALKELYLELNKNYYGSNLHLDPLLAYECLRIPHFYYNFYVYQYATGISAAYALAEKVLNKEEGALQNYLNFLSAGCSKFPLEILKDAGVDMKSSDPIVRLIKRFDYLVDCLEKEFEQID